MIENTEIDLPDFVPDYISDEIDRYLWKKQNGNSGVSTLYNVLGFI